MKLIYLAGAITRGDTTYNVAQADDAMLSLMRSGFAVVNPMLSCYAGAARSCRDRSGIEPFFFDPDPKAHGGFRDIPHAAWLAMDCAIVERCDAVLRLPGESAGADVETAHADSLGIPVFHSLSAVLAAFPEADQ